MADLSDVLTILAQQVELAVYPNGISNPSVADVNVEIVTGWPIKAKLDSDLKAGNAQISIYCKKGMDKNTTRFPKVWQPVSYGIPTLTLSTLFNTVTISGTITRPQNCVIFVNKIGYAYAVQENDTLNTIASALATLIPGATSMGPVITVSGVTNLSARVGTYGVVARELKRQKRLFMISIWAPTPDIRTLLGSAIEVYFADIERLTMPDDFSARIIWQSGYETDEHELSVIYRRDLNFSVEYATTQSMDSTQIIDPYANIELTQAIT